MEYETSLIGYSQNFLKMKQGKMEQKMFHVSHRVLARTAHIAINIVASWDKCCEKDGGG